MDEAEWARGVPESITADALWRCESYRRALFAADRAWLDVRSLAHTPCARVLADQLYRSVGSVSANIAEGCSRGSAADRVRFFEYALGSAREARDWYFKARFAIGTATADDRMRLLTSVIRLLLIALPQERRRSVRR
jgi:four helix bundle protein